MCRPGVGPGRAGGPSTFYIMVGGPARPVKFSEDGPRPGLAHQISEGRAAARPGRSKFQRMGRRPTQPIIFSIFHGPAHQFFRTLGPARSGPDKRHMTNPVFFLSPHIWVLYYLLYWGLEGSYIASEKKQT